jgi:hypothetical protein
MELHASCPCHFTPWETAHSTHCTEGWVGSRTGLKIMEKRKISCLCPGIKPQFLHHPAHSLVTILTELSWQKKRDISDFHLETSKFSMLLVTIPIFFLGIDVL